MLVAPYLGTRTKGRRIARWWTEQVREAVERELDQNSDEIRTHRDTAELPFERSRR
jgi:hypothetical protein